ncbi:MAG: formate dehydrogenase accessory sulfurtransferase FdhD [Xanthomonadales bacterium]|nr:formate dehydrogenase accessory sulfurtransferase FdhD [Gammaproteobacteria bacterium]MBT8053285.1 formate dehydrogenase accessory sulfurtransferase FdhD [Gammaproteobacteria bacterium]NND58474.1 formate dehydrogenase accessory sulfurtransferase FdhD [Xanthomonadales bacterium]NNK50105.1 formate dehydrogenase accessory sulfurtransferase FdhD [Xanthomonadales bacterium]
MSESRGVRVSQWRSLSTEEGPAGAHGPPGRVETADDCIASEVPVAFTFNRVSHVVMMASPCDLEDFAVGFSVTEGLVGSTDDIENVRVIPRTGGIELAMTINEAWFDRLATQRRNMAGRTGCGLCGAENIEQALRRPQPVGRALETSHTAMQNAVQALENHQPLQARTGAAHGAAWCSPQGDILALREDIGRHNALDKLIGGLLRSGSDPAAGFALVSSRASYEMVLKTAAAGMELILAVSAPTSLAVEFAERSGVTLVGFARPGRHNVYTFPERIMEWG